MPAVVFVVPGRLDTATGGSTYDRRLVEGLRRLGWDVSVIELTGTFPFPDADATSAARRALIAVPDGSLVLVDGLAFGALPDVALGDATRLRFVPVVHLPLALEIGLSPETAAQLERSERRALATAEVIVVTGEGTRDALIRYDVEPGRIHLIRPGTDTASLAHGSGSSRIEILCVATINPGKGHKALIRALAAVDDDVDWHLTCVGSDMRHPACASELRAAIHSRQLDDRVTLTGELRGHALDARYRGSDLFALATRSETFGMAVAEAIAHGLPVVSTRTGAIPELVGPDAGVLVPPDDAAAFASALARVLRDSDLRRRLAAGARIARDRLPTWDGTLDKIVGLLRALHV